MASTTKMTSSGGQPSFCSNDAETMVDQRDRGSDREVDPAGEDDEGHPNRDRQQESVGR